MGYDEPWVAALVAGCGGILIGIFPKIVDALRARKHELREDKKSVVDQYDRLLDEIRLERDDVRQQREKLEGKYDSMRDAHLDCEKRCAAQDVKLAHMSDEIRRLEGRVIQLESTTEK